MSAFKSQQRHLTIAGRAFHFVSYESVPANPKRSVEAQPPMWYAMVGGRRWPVWPCDPSLTLPQLDQALCAWAEANAMGPAGDPTEAEKAAPRNRKYENWWGPN